MLRASCLRTAAACALALCSTGGPQIARADKEVAASTRAKSRAPEPIALTLMDGTLPVDVTLAPKLVIEVYPAPDQPPRKVTLSPSFREERGRKVAQLEDAESGARVRMQLTPLPDGAVELFVEVKYARRVWQGLSAVDLPLPGPARVLDRDLDLRTVHGTAWLDRFETKKVRAGDVTVLVDDSVDAVQVKRVSDSETSVRVELFSTEARPFKHEGSCRADWRHEKPLLTLPARVREPGDRDVTRIELRSGAGGFLSKARYPEGRASALVITDHADQTSPDTFIALARGRSDTVRPVGGLEKNNLVITKSLFLRGEFEGEGRRQLEDLRVAAVAEEMAALGSEIGPHSVTPNADEREVTAEGLTRFDHYHPSTWIDHQPMTNCEAFTNEGWRADEGAAKWRIADLLSAHGYRYIWSGFDVPQELDLLGGSTDGAGPERRPISLWPIGRLQPGDPAGAAERWLFTTTWMLVDREDFYRTLGPDRLDRLARDRGLAILHTYLESLHLSDDNPRFANRNVLVRKHGVVEIDPRFEKILEDFRARIDAGSLWMPTLRGLGDHLRAVEKVRVRYDEASAGRTALVVSPVAVRGMTFRVAGSAKLTIDGRPPAGRREEHGSTVFWFDLPASRVVKVELAAPEVDLTARK